MSELAAQHSNITPPFSETTVLNRTTSLYNTVQRNTYDSEFTTLPISFISANRVVSVLEKAIERLGLLTLLDTTSPGDNTTRPFFTSSSFSPSHEKSSSPTDLNPTINSTFKPRKAAVLISRPDEMSRKTTREVRAALLSAANMQHIGRPTVADLVMEQQRLEYRYGELLRQTKLANPSPNEPQLHPTCFAAFRDVDKSSIMEELKQISKKLREHNKALFIQLKDNPNDADNWKKVGNERTELIQLLQSLVREITTGYDTGKNIISSGSIASGGGGGGGGGGSSSSAARPRRSIISESICTEGKDNSLSLMGNRFGSAMPMKRAAKGPQAPRIPLFSTYERFAKLISDEKNAQRWADELLLKEKELNQNVKQLQHDLKTEKILKEKEVTERRQRIAELKVKLQQEKKRVKEHGEMVRAEVEASHEARQRNAHEEERVVMEKIQHVEEEQKVEVQAHRDFEEHLIERTEAMDELGVQWDKKNQTEIKRVEARKIDVEQMRQQCAERLQKAQKDKELELQLKAERDEELRREAAEKNAVEERTMLEYEAVSQIQSAIRACFTRQALNVLKKKNKKRRKSQKN